MERIGKVIFAVCYLSLAICAVAFAQFTVGSRSFSGGAAIRYVTNLIGLNYFNQNFSESSNTIDAMRFVYGEFQQQTPLTYPAADACTVSYGGKIYSIGGYGTSPATDFLAYVQIYDPVADTWSQGTPIPTATWGMACDEYNGNIYIFGGDTLANPAGVSDAYAYNIAGNSWSTLATMPSGPWPDGAMAVTVANDIYILYGNVFLQYDPSGNAYTALTSPPGGAARQWSATGYFNISGDERIYYLGGSTSPGSGFTNSTYYYSVSSSTWSSALTAAPYAAHGQLQRAIYNGSLYYIAGYDGNVFYQTLYAYTPASDTWSSALGYINAWRDGVTGGFVGNTLYVIGGRNANTVFSPFGVGDNESYKLGSSPLTQAFTKLQLNYTQFSPTGSVELGIYSDSSGAPNSLILDAGSATIINGWTIVSGLNITSLTPGTPYWLVFDQSNANSVSYTAGSPANILASDSHCYNTQAYGALPSTFPTSGMTCTQASMYGEKLTVN